MRWTLSSITYGTLEFRPFIPVGFSSLVVPGSVIHSAEGPFGKIMHQEINAGQSVIQYNIYRLTEDMAIDFTLNQSAVFTQIALKGSLRHDFTEIGPVYLKTGQFSFLHYPTLTGTTYLEGHHEYRTFNTFYATDVLVDLLPYFPYLGEVLNNMQLKRYGRLFENNGWINAQIREMADYLLHCRFEGSLRRFYFDMKMKEFLLLLLKQEQQWMDAMDGMSKIQFDCVQESRQIIDTRFSTHITLSDIAREVGLNEFKLKTGFRQLFGIGMFEYLLKTRMQKARNLLLETKLPIKDVAHRTGYTSKQSFQNAFKKYFEETPGSFRRV